MKETISEGDLAIPSYTVDQRSRKTTSAEQAERTGVQLCLYIVRDPDVTGEERQNVLHSCATYQTKIAHAVRDPHEA